MGVVVCSNVRKVSDEIRGEGSILVEICQSAGAYQPLDMGKNN